MPGLVLAVLATGCGLTLTRALRLPISIAPLGGLAALAVLTVWCTALGAPPLLRSALALGLALCGLAVGFGDVRRALAGGRAGQAPVLVLAGAVVVPVVLLGAGLAGVEIPMSNHDGAFHVETIDSLRHGFPVPTWYPIGFHTSVAAVLGLMPWLDTARGTAEVAQGLTFLAPLAVFSFGLALGLDTLGAAIAAAILALTWTYPYDFQMWDGWPQGMGIVLLIGVWTAALRWTQQPAARWAVLAGLFVGAIVVSHGTELYSSALGLAVIGAARRRQMVGACLIRHAPLAIGVSALIAAPYLPTLLGWASAGGAVVTGQLTVIGALTNPDPVGADDWLQFLSGLTGAAALLDLPVRLALLSIGLRLRRLRLAASLWVAFVVLLVVSDFSALAPIGSIFAATFPWLADHRPRQVAVLLASVLAAGGLRVALASLGHWRVRLAARPTAWRRLAVSGAVLLGFFVEGSAVSIYKRVAQVASEQNVYTADDAAAMAWLRQHARPGEVLANDQAVDAGIWAPYKADMPILLPRSSANSDPAGARQTILAGVLDLQAQPAARAQACALHVEYLYSGARLLPYDVQLVPNRSILEHASGLEEVFSAGDAAVFRIREPCR